MDKQKGHLQSDWHTGSVHLLWSTALHLFASFFSIFLLQITPESENDFGSYNCSASNEMGTESKEFLLIQAGQWCFTSFCLVFSGHGQMLKYIYCDIKGLLIGKICLQDVHCQKWLRIMVIWDKSISCFSRQSFKSPIFHPMIKTSFTVGDHMDQFVSMVDAFRWKTNQTNIT